MTPSCEPDTAALLGGRVRQAGCSLNSKRQGAATPLYCTRLTLTLREKVIAMIQAQDGDDLV